MSPTKTNRDGDPPAIDLAGVLARLDGDLTLLGRLLPQFIDASVSRAAALRTALAAGDEAKAGAVLHQIKGSAASVGAAVMAELAAEAERTLHRDGTAALAGCADSLERALDGVRRAAAQIGGGASGAAGAEHIPALLDFLKTNNLRALDVIKDCEAFLIEEMGRDRAGAVLAAVDGLDFAGAYEKLAGLLPAGAVR